MPPTMPPSQRRFSLVGLSLARSNRSFKPFLGPLAYPAAPFNAA